MNILFTLPVALLILVAVAACFFIPLHLSSPKRGTLPPDSRKELDKAGRVIGIILGILYLPLSLVSSFAGLMACEGFMSGATALQSFLCDLLSILGLFPIFVCLGGLAAASVLRSRGYSRWSFGLLFAGIGYCAFIFILLAVLYAV